VKKKPRAFVELDYKRAAVAFWRSGKTGRRRSFAAVKARYRKIKNERILYEWDKQLSSGGSNYDKYLTICNFVLQKFKLSKVNRVIIHDVNLRIWAVTKARELGLVHFKASHGWILKFKAANKIVSRKITRFITKLSAEQDTQLHELAEQFVQATIPYVNNNGPETVYNTDQSGFSLELHSGRTLDIQGVRAVEAVVQSKSAMTHSYTIQPVISASGKLLSPLFLVLKEPTGSFGPRIMRSMFMAVNVHVTSSRSGKVTKDIVRQWFKDVFFPNIGTPATLILDSLTTQNDEQLIKQILPSNIDFEFFTLPPGTTPLIQPLDVYFFRVWKNFVRKFSDHVVMNELSVQLSQRDNIIKLQSLVHNQFSSPRYESMIRYAWYKCGYLEQNEKFVNPVEFCFEITMNNCSFCDTYCFIRCSWCQMNLCFEHFYENYHFCETYIA
jgi:Tc5 transposase C-terminal domain/DDE superfamily endonuclease